MKNWEVMFKNGQNEKNEQEWVRWIDSKIEIDEYSPG